MTRPAIPVEKAFLGVGWAFPVQPGPDGDVAMAAYEDDIREAVHIILATRPGERVMRPDFGAGLHQLVFEPITTTTLTLARHRVEEALVRWEPRIDHVTVRVEADPPLGRLLISIDYRVRATNTFYNLVYPFYVMEGREGP
jgi:phage baseplate assembly protein W